MALVSCGSMEEPPSSPSPIAATKPAPSSSPTVSAKAVVEAVSVVRGSLLKAEVQAAEAAKEAEVAKKEGARLTEKLRVAEQRGEASRGELIGFRELSESLEMILREAREESARRAETLAEARELVDVLEGEVAATDKKIAVSEQEKESLRIALDAANDAIVGLTAEGHTIHAQSMKYARDAENWEKESLRKGKWFWWFWLLVAVEVVALGLFIWLRSKAGLLF